MQANQAPPVMPETPPAQPEAEATAPRVYDCAGCRYVDAHGLVCDVCLRKILDSQADRRSRHDRRERKYSSKYALTELLVCGDCGTPYRRVTWSRNGEKKIVWRCISRLDYGTKYCKKSPTLEEGAVQDAVVDALMGLARRDPAILETLKLHIGMGLRGGDGGEDEYALRQRLLGIESELGELILLETQDGNQGNYDAQFEKLYGEKVALKARLDQIQAEERHADNEQARLTDIFAELEKLRRRPIGFEDVVVRQMIECVRVLSGERLLVCFRLGGEMEVGMDVCARH